MALSHHQVDRAAALSAHAPLYAPGLRPDATAALQLPFTRTIGSLDDPGASITMMQRDSSVGVALERVHGECANGLAVCEIDSTFTCTHVRSDAAKMLLAATARTLLRACKRYNFGASRMHLRRLARNTSFINDFVSGTIAAFGCPPHREQVSRSAQPTVWLVIKIQPPRTTPHEERDR